MISSRLVCEVDDIVYYEVDRIKVKIAARLGFDRSVYSWIQNFESEIMSGVASDCIFLT